MPDHTAVAVRDLSFSHDAAVEPLFERLSVHFPVGFTGIIGANGAGKSTLLKLIIGALQPDGGSIEGVADAVYCAQRTDHPPATLYAFLDDWSGGACELRGRLGVETDFQERWSTLSHGERKRAQIAHALWQSPDLLAIDEPTNHIDRSARRLLLNSLERFRGVGLIVSHDRELLDALCSQCLWLEPPIARVFPGGFSQARELRAVARDSAVRERSKLKQAHRRLKQEASKRRETAAGEHRARSKRGLDSKDSDGREKIDRARVTDGGAGGALRQLDSRVARSQAELDGARIDKTYETGIWLAGSRARRDTVLKLDAGATDLGMGRHLHWPDISIKPDDRIAITGANGTGKSTFVNYLLPRLNVPGAHAIVLPQEVPAAMARELLAQVRTLPKAQLGHIMNIVSRLNSRPERLLDSQQPSPGEIRKLLLASGMSRAPQLIVMDEPTNHLDLPSIEALESALVDCPCALLLVSHDQRFIDGIGAQTWRLERNEQSDSVLATE
ncbi:MAG: ATP-binding cassette domain-containing protein [Pseudomonadota bacterium]